MTQRSADTIKQAVRDRYGRLARQASGSEEESRCGPTPCCGATAQAIGEENLLHWGEGASEASRLYGKGELKGLPDTVTAASAGCGNPTAISGLRPGETVLDLGSGGGIDCFLAREKVGPQGRVIGLDMTTDMIELARKNAGTLGYTNVEFRQGEMEEIPVPDGSVDVVISNCVISLSPDKDAVFREAFRVLKSGGRFCVSDIVLQQELPGEIRESLEQWTECVAGALLKDTYLGKIRDAGFSDVEVVEEKGYAPTLEHLNNVLSITLEATKP